VSAYKEVKKKSKRGLLLTVGALVTLGAVTVYKKGKSLIGKIGEKMKSCDN
jgi:hypothetical protein